MNKIVIVDIDGTIAGNPNQVPGLGRGSYDWHRVGEDSPIKEVFRLLFNLLAYSPVTPFFLTGRSEVCRVETSDWLIKNFIRHLPDGCVGKDNYRLIMRGDKDYRKGHEFKHDYYESHIKGKYEVLCAFDDDPATIDFYMEEEIVVLQPHVWWLK